MSKCIVGDNTYCNEKYHGNFICFPEELSIIFGETGTEIEVRCKEYKKRVGRQNNVYILDDYAR